MTYGHSYVLAAFIFAIYAIPLLIVVWQVIKSPVRAWIPLLFFLGLILLTHGVSEFIGPDGMTALIYILAGVK